MKLYSMKYNGETRSFEFQGLQVEGLPSTAFPAKNLPAGVYVSLSHEKGGCRTKWSFTGTTSPELSGGLVSATVPFSQGALVKAILSGWEAAMLAEWAAERDQAERIISE